MVTTLYRRTPLPKQAHPPVGWLALCVTAVILSPFAGFAVHGTVDSDGLIIGLKFAVLPLAGLVAIAALRWHAWRRLPARIAAEWTHGRVVTAEGAPVVTLPANFTGKSERMEILPDGVLVTRPTLLAIRGGNDAAARRWIAEQTGELFVAWNDIVEWVVDTDSDGPDYHLLKLRPEGEITVRRFKPVATTECDLLDAVRSAGKLPVRLRCDVSCG